MSDWGREAMSREERAWYDGTLRGQIDQLNRDAIRLGAVNLVAGLDQLTAKMGERRDQAIRDHFKN